MTVYVLVHDIDYEGTAVLGVYTDKAKADRLAHDGNRALRWVKQERLRVSEFTLDAAPVPAFSA